MPESLQAQLVKNDTRVLVAFWRKRGERPSHEEILNYNYDRALSTLHWRGGPQYARIKACVTHMPNATCVSVPNLGQGLTPSNCGNECNKMWNTALLFLACLR